MLMVVYWTFIFPFTSWWHHRLDLACLWVGMQNCSRQLQPDELLDHNIFFKGLMSLCLPFLSVLDGVHDETWCKLLWQSLTNESYLIRIYLAAIWTVDSFLLWIDCQCSLSPILDVKHRKVCYNMKNWYGFLSSQMVCMDLFHVSRSISSLQLLINFALHCMIKA